MSCQMGAETPETTSIFAVADASGIVLSGRIAAILTGRAHALMERRF